MKHSNHFRFFLSLILAFSLVFSVIPASTTYAANTNSLYKEIAKNFLARKKSFSVKCKKDSTTKNIISKIGSDDDEPFYSMLYEICTSVDNATTDDADYLYANISQAYCYYSNGRLYFSDMGYFETTKEVQQVNKKIKSIAKGIKSSSSSKYKQAQLAYQKIASMMSYDNRSDDKCYFSAYGGLFKGKTVCNGYALIMYKLLMELDIPCHIISGMGNGDGEWELHAWNIVKMDGKWYNLDLTWDDNGSKATYDFFLKGSSSFDKTHKRDTWYKTNTFKKQCPTSSSNYKGKSSSSNNSKDKKNNKDEYDDYDSYDDFDDYYNYDGYDDFDDYYDYDGYDDYDEQW